MIVVAILAILAVVAVPAFIKYMRRAKTTEAIDELDKIHKSAAQYYARGGVVSGTGNSIDCQFPTNQELTPDVTAKACCGNSGGGKDADKDDRCDVESTLWDVPVWSALNFEMKDQHYFGYSFFSSGTRTTAIFTARANGDLDCDGALSTFERYGSGGTEGTSAECSMQQASAYFKMNETE